MPRTLCLISALLLAAAASSQAQSHDLLREKTRFLLKDGVTHVQFCVNARVQEAITAQLAWMNFDDRWIDSKSTDFTATPGESCHLIPAPLPAVSRPSAQSAFRLFYKLEKGGAMFTQGVLAFPTHADYAFDTWTISNHRIQSGKPLVIRARTLHPYTHRPVSQVVVTATIESDEEGRALTLPAVVSGPDGYAIIEGAVPANFGDDVDVVVKFRKGDLEVTTGLHSRLTDPEQTQLWLDKPLHQPGQTVHMRILALAENRRPLRDKDVEFQVSDLEGTILFQSTTKTTRFGIATASWPVPKGAKDGQYRLEVEVNEGQDLYEQLDIRKYELPTFRVTGKTDRLFYLKGQDAEVAINAEYLFGKPVVGAKVRVERTFLNDAAHFVVNGITGSDGVFKLKVPTAPIYKRIEEGSDTKFSDAQFSVSITDSTTRRSETTTFSIRTTSQALHLTWIDGRYDGQGYVSATLADGTPARCSVTVVEESGASQVVETNRYGLARVILKDTNTYGLKLAGRTPSGWTGAWNGSRFVAGRSGVRVFTDRTLYRRGEPVRVRIAADTDDTAALVEVARSGLVLATAKVALQNGTGDAEIPFHPLFHRELSVTALAGRESNRSLAHSGQTILFTGAGHLSAAVKFDKDQYKPGENARAALLARRGDKPVEAAFGVSIADEAVYQRAESDRGNVYRYRGDQYGVQTNEVSGVTRADLYNWNPVNAIDSELDLVGELMLRHDRVEPPESRAFDTMSSIKNYFLQRGHHDSLLQATAVPAHEFPGNQTETQAFFEQRFSDNRRLRDPWSNRYRYRYSATLNDETIQVSSIGPDQVENTEDDYEVFRRRQPYFSRWSDSIRRAIQTTEDLPTTQSVDFLLKRAGVDLAAFRDPWNQPIWWTWATIGDHRMVSFWSDGPPSDEPPDPPERPVPLGSFQVYYFGQHSEKINRLLLDSNARPKTAPEFVATLKDLGFDLAAVRDPWGNPYRVEMSERTEYRNKSVPVTAADRERGVIGQTRLVPVTVKVSYFVVQSDGPDSGHSRDDVTVGSYGRIETERRGDRLKKPQPVKRHVRPALSASRGLIEGVITDATGAVVPNAEVVAIDDTGKEFPGLADTNGYYVLDLPAGRTYKLRASSSGFKVALHSGLRVMSRTSLRLDLRLDIGTVREAVEVSAAQVVLMTSASQVSRVMQTPRLRENFVETLVWEPSVETNPQGEAEIRFRMADNITRWRTVLMGSTLDGETFESTSSIRSFQPFFADLNPPAVLTKNDKIELAVPVRNYTDSSQEVEARIDPQPWMKVLGKPVLPLDIGSNATSIALFNLEAAFANADASQQITVAGANVSDAIRKPLNVHPDGREAAATGSAVMQGAGMVEVDVPDNIVEGSLTGEVKVYPNLAAHVIESLEGLAKRPAGCAEQTTSTLYANVLVARLLAKENVLPELAAKALQNIRDGLVNLSAIQRESGGFGYSDSAPDPRLTAYVLQCLRDVHQLAGQQEWDQLSDHAETLIKKTKASLVSLQQPNGAWKDPWDAYWPQRQRSVLLTAVTARALAGLDDAADKAAVKGIDYAERMQIVADDPCITATLALAARQIDDERAEKWTNRVAKLAKVENGAHYWALEHNGLFGGWGDAGRTEATGIAVEALAAGKAHTDLVNSAIRYLLRKKDRYGIWYATSSTIAVMRGMITAIEAVPQAGGTQKTLDVIVNGQAAASIPLPGGAKPVPLESRSMTRFLKPGRNQIEFRGADSIFSAQAVANYYLPWAPITEMRPQGAQSRLLLDVKMSRTTGGLEDWVYCNAVARRVGYWGGMMVAEIGLPPGADVDRASLSNAFPAPYEIKPDRIVFYLWPRAEGNAIRFRFKPRLRMQAKSASFQVWDYYNPDLKTELQPIRFDIR